MEETKDEKQFQEFTAEGESPEAIEFRKKDAALNRKLDLFVAPVMMLLMLISYLDRRYGLTHFATYKRAGLTFRSNIGFAATQGMIDDIGLKGSEYNVSYYR